MENHTTAGRPRSNSRFSFRSQKSDVTKNLKLDLTETEADKKKSRFSGKSKVNPNRALNEPQPLFEALEKPTLPELRTSQFRDSYGNVIADPDKTNPARNRLERPLDTIRAFEAAIDNSHKRRSQAVRAESADVVPGFQSRRTSMAFNGMNEIPHFAPRYSPSNVGYGPHNSSSSQVGYGHRNSSYGQAGYGSRHSPPGQLGYGSRHTSFRGNYEYGQGQFPQRRGMPHRTITSPSRVSVDHGLYNTHAYQVSHDTVNTAAESSGSHSTEPLGYSTDPSSENSSIDRVHAFKNVDGGDAYGTAYGRGSPMHMPIQEEYLQQDGRFQQQQQQEYYPRSPVPQQGPMAPQGFAPRPQRGPPPSSYLQAPAQRHVIQLGGDSASGAQQPQSNYSIPSKPQAPAPAEKPEKRGSWLKRRFSKNN